jgi:hypothetical protein
MRIEIAGRNKNPLQIDAGDFYFLVSLATNRDDASWFAQPK